MDMPEGSLVSLYLVTDLHVICLFEDLKSNNNQPDCLLIDQ